MSMGYPLGNAGIRKAEPSLCTLCTVRFVGCLGLLQGYHDVSLALVSKEIGSFIFSVVNTLIV